MSVTLTHAVEHLDPYDVMRRRYKGIGALTYPDL